MSFERIEPGTAAWDAFYANHIHRYRFASEILREREVKKVLDAACGVGYGARHLADATDAEIVAVDRDEHALAIARRDFPHPRVRLLADDCQTLKAARESAPYDAITSFETLEHLKEPRKFLGAVAEVLAPGGLLVISVPNGDVGSSEDWEFHEHDFDANELETALGEAGLETTRLFGQSLNELGRLREELRGEVHRLRSNPFVRLGTWIQTRLRGHARPGPALVERIEDLEMAPMTAPDIREQGEEGPFVIVALATKP